jgi:hypothetical protein
LPKLSDRQAMVRTNSESLLGDTSRSATLIIRRALPLLSIFHACRHHH